MKNLSKRVDVFLCTHDSHHEFENVVSDYHVLKEKGCHLSKAVFSPMGRREENYFVSKGNRTPNIALCGLKRSCPRLIVAWMTGSC